MTSEQARTLLVDAASALGEHFDAVQIHASWLNDEGNTTGSHGGYGNWYARQHMAREFTQLADAQYQAEAMKEEEE